MVKTFQELVHMSLDDIKALQIEDQGSGYISQEDDTADFFRPYWYAEACPKSSECTLKSFKGARCWSYQSAEVCRLYVAKHMCMSGHHDLRAPQALEAANLAVVVEGNETWAERDQIRKCWDKQQPIGSAKQQPIGSAKQQRIGSAPSKSRMVKRNIVLKTKWKGPVKRERIDEADEVEAEPEQEDAGDDVEDAGEDAEEDAGEDAGDDVEDDQDELALAMDDDAIEDALGSETQHGVLMRMAMSWRRR